MLSILPNSNIYHVKDNGYNCSQRSMNFNLLNYRPDSIWSESLTKLTDKP